MPYLCFADTFDISKASLILISLVSAGVTLKESHPNEFLFARLNSLGLVFGQPSCISCRLLGYVCMPVSCGAGGWRALGAEYGINMSK